MDNIKKASITIPKEKLFSYWLACTQPLHKISNKNQEVLAELLKLRYEYSFKVNDKDLLDELVFSTKNRARIMDSLKLSSDRFNNILTELRRAGALNGTSINSKFIPVISDNSKKYSIIFEFNFE